MAEAAVAERVAVQNLLGGAVPDILPLGIGMLDPAALLRAQIVRRTLQRFLIGSLRRHTAALLRERIAVDAGSPVESRRLTVSRFARVDKEVLIRNLSVDMLRLHIVVTHPGEAGDLRHLRGKLHRVRGRQRQQRQAHKCYQHNGKDSDCALLHGAKPLNLEKIVIFRNFFDSLATSIIS